MPDAPRLPGEARIIRANALALPLPDESVDLIVTSPPYFALRAYKDGDETYEGQLGAEATPEEFVDALIEATREMMRVLKPSGSIFVNLGDKYAGSAGWCASEASAQSSTLVDKGRQQRQTHGEPPRAPRTNVRPKSLIGVPWRYALRCIDELGLILRAEIVWAKPNGLPESVTDRVRRSHEQWFHFTKQPRYFSAVDEIREPHAAVSLKRAQPHRANVKAHEDSHTVNMTQACNPLGKLPGSVWTVPTEPLKVDPALGIDHFAAFPTEWPRRIILGWSPSAICTVCDEGLRPVVKKDDARPLAWRETQGHKRDGTNGLGGSSLGIPALERNATIIGYACACDEPIASPTGRRAESDPSLETGRAGFNRPRSEGEGTTVTTRWQHAHWAAELRNSPHRDRIQRVAARLYGQYAFAHWIRTDVAGARPIPVALRTALLRRGWLTQPPLMGERVVRPAVVLDPFSGTGTTAGVAKALGRIGIGVDMSADYCRLAEWRTNGDGYEKLERKVLERTYGKQPRAPKSDPSLFDE